MIKYILYSLISFFLFSCSSDSDISNVKYDVTAIEFKKIINSEKGIILDVRTIEEVNEGKIQGATNIDFYDLYFTSKLDLISRDVPIYVYCRSGGRSSRAALKMQELGFNKVYNLLGGIGDWKSNNFKVVKTEAKIFNKPKSISNAEFSMLIKNNNIVLVDFSTQWCLPCMRMMPIIKEIKEENGDIDVIFIDADINTDLVKKYKISGVPVFIVYKNGLESFRHSGMIDKIDLVNQIN